MDASRDANSIRPGVGARGHGVPAPDVAVLSFLMRLTYLHGSLMSTKRANL